MARVLLLSATPTGNRSPENLALYLGLRRSSELDRFGVHSLTDDPDSADIIAFIELYGAGFYFERVRRHSFVKKYRAKCFLVSTIPNAIPFLPGVYTSIEKRWFSSRVRRGFYFGRPENPFIAFSPPRDDLSYLYSFMGSIENAPVRRVLATLVHPRGFFQDTSAEYQRRLQGKMEDPEAQDYYRRYADLTSASKFVLCPRGISVSSRRVFETMSAGRVPVILSDQWIAPVGPDWDKFAIRLPESEVADIPRLLGEREEEAVAMGKLARAQWEQWFSDEAAFHRVIEWCLAIRNERRVPEYLGRLPAYLHYLRPVHLRHLLRRPYRFLRRFISTPQSKN